ncbi:MAG: AAA family ATPase [Bacteroidales bacterium]|nr:AAA family ATPase [Bacteroidales bacterium]
MGKKDDELVFQSETDVNGKVLIKFNAEFEKSTENQTLISVIQKDLAKPNKSVLKLLSNISNEGFNDCRNVTRWFSKKLRVILPESYPFGLANRLDKEPKFKDFANDLLVSFSTGINNIGAEVIPLDELLEDQKNFEIERIKSDLLANPKRLITIKLQGEETIFVNENGTIKAKKLYLEHLNDKKEPVKFRINEESNGTARLIEYIPAIQDIIKTDAVYVIDEIERSIHPLAIKELISKFSLDENTKGQLIFSTHECNLLDQDLLRQDEIWFAEKNTVGATELYPLSEFKEHHTIDIRKGYLNGRYGAIPFLGNLKDLNWHKYEDTN